MAARANSAERGQRRWRGRAPADRAADRRERLLAAGLELMGSAGARAVSMRGVCRQAGLTERYFYESFDHLDELLVAVLESVVLGARDALLEALRSAPSEPAALIRHGVRAFTQHVKADPRRGRVMFVESLATPALTARGNELVGEFTEPIAAIVRDTRYANTPDVPDPDETDIELNALAIFGALAFVYQRWLQLGPDRVPEERFVTHVAQLVERLVLVRSR